MIFVSGKLMCGKVDQVPGLFHVATRFMHIYWIPIWPTQTYLLAKSSNLQSALPAVTAGLVGIPIHSSWKSIAVGYGRGMIYATLAWLVLLLVICGIELAERKHTVDGLEHMWPVFAVIATAMLLICWLSYRFTRPSVERAIELGGMLGIPEAIVRARVSGESLEEASLRSQ